MKKLIALKVFIFFFVFSFSWFSQKAFADYSWVYKSTQEQTNACLEFDLLFPFNQGYSVDVHLSSNNYNEPSHAIAINQTTNLYYLTTTPSWEIVPNTVLPSSGTHHIKFCVQNNIQTLYIDGSLLQSWNDGKVSTYLDAGLFTNQPEVIGNISITYANSGQNLLVTPIKQTSDPWRSQIYDSANKWAPTSPTINSWGCALTSAAMVLKYYNINWLPNGDALDPGTLNAWLKNQPDGYVGEGLLNWIALSRLSRQSKIINNLNYDALEYKRTNGNISQLNADINAGIPDILREPGHFIVAKGINGNTFNINDPYYNRTTLDSGYNNTFQNIGNYTKSTTDLSYIMLTINPNVNINMINSNGQTIGNAFLEDSIVNPENSNQVSSPIKIYYIQKPEDENYTITLSSSSTSQYNLEVYLYDTNGNVDVQTFRGNLKQNQEVNYNINYKKGLLTDLNSFFSDGSIDNSGIFNSLLVKITTTTDLNNFINELNAQKGKHINQNAYDTLIADLNNI